jgi:hypothetical protein
MGNRCDPRGKYFFVIIDKVERLGYFDVVLIYFLDFNVNSVHFVDPLNDFFLLKLILLA